MYVCLFVKERVNYYDCENASSEMCRLECLLPSHPSHLVVGSEESCQCCRGDDTLSSFSGPTRWCCWCETDERLHWNSRANQALYKILWHLVAYENDDSVMTPQNILEYPDPSFPAVRLLLCVPQMFNYYPTCSVLTWIYLFPVCVVECWHGSH